MTATNYVDAKEGGYARMNQSPGGLQSSLDDWLEKIRLKLEGFKGGPVLILAAVLGVVIVLWTA
jgi:hypothetical protein